jgi:adenosine deaminase
MNAYEQVARGRKVDALVDHLDKTMARIGFDPHREANLVAAVLRELSPESMWTTYAEAIGQRKPSPTTRAAVIAVYERRAAP